MTGGATSWRIRHREVTESTNADAAAGEPGDVFTADLQMAGRGRLDHRWLSPAGENLTMSAVIGVDGSSPEEVATLPLVVGLAVAKAVAALLGDGGAVRLKWPNDVLVGGRKICGILCERNGGRVIAGVGVNVNQAEFASEIATSATSLLLAKAPAAGSRLPEVRDAVLMHLCEALAEWRDRGFAKLWPQVAQIDFLKGLAVSVKRTDGDDSPASGVCGGIQPDGSLLVGGERVYAGEAHVLFHSRP